MKIKNITLALSLTLLGGMTSFSQFSGNEDPDFGSGGNLWYDWTGDGSTSEITKLVLDENSESFYFSGALNDDGFNAIVVKSSLDGELDTDFPEGTINYDPFIGLDDRFESVAIQENGKIVAVGYSIMGPGDTDIIVARFNTDGTFDPTFNGGTVLTFDEGGLDFATDVAIQEDGKILVIGSYQVSPTDLDLFFLRLNSDGTPDGTFGLGGAQVLNTYSGTELVSSVTQLESGAISAVGQAGDDILMVQLDEDGNFDTDFGTDGTVNFRINSSPSIANKLIELPDGKLLLAGNNNSEGEDGMNGFVVKMSPTGLFDTGFNGGEGFIQFDFETEEGVDTSYTLQDMEVLDNGQILIVGDYETGTDNIGMILLNDNGEIDTEFGDEGMRQYNLSGGSLPNFNSQIEISSSGKVYLSAKVVNGSFEDIVTVRLFGDVTSITEENQVQLNLVGYPNPTQGEFNLTVTLEKAETLDISIYDMSGKMVTNPGQQFLSAGTQTLALTETADLQTGTYWLEVRTENGQETLFFVKQ